MAKADILHFLSRVLDASAADVAASLGVSLPAAGMTLLRLVRGGLACRTFDPDAQWYSYALTAKGRARLDFFEAQDATRSGREAGVPEEPSHRMDRRHHDETEEIAHRYVPLPDLLH